jgi:acetate kinase
MRILVIDTGSSSVKFDVFDMETGEECLSSKIERVNSIDEALASVPAMLAKAGEQRFDAIGQRVAHGGERFHDAVIIDAAVIADIEACVPLAPLHNPPALAGITMVRKVWPKVPQVAVFDTAFHHAMPEHAIAYAVPQDWRKAGVRRYGFHGTSHQYIMERVAQELKTPVSELRIISCHLGNGASICAINRGQSVDTSMGLTALEGLVMGTRCGDLDPGIYGYLHQALGLSIAQIEDALYHKSGLAGLSGLGNDMRDIEKKAEAGNKDAALALEVFCYRLRKYIGAYAAAMEGIDALAFTGGVGENSVFIRKRVCAGFEYLGLVFDETRNAGVKLKGFEAPQLQRHDSRIKVLVTQTREQWMIARETYRLLTEGARHAAET